MLAPCRARLADAERGRSSAPWRVRRPPTIPAPDYAVGPSRAWGTLRPGQAGRTKPHGVSSAPSRCRPDFAGPQQLRRRCCWHKAGTPTRRRQLCARAELTPRTVRHLCRGRRDAAQGQSRARRRRGARREPRGRGCCPADDLLGPGGLEAIADRSDAARRAGIRRRCATSGARAGAHLDVRAALLDRARQASGRRTTALLDFACALARQCFINEYVYALGEDERLDAERLQAELADALAQGRDVAPLSLAVAGELRSAVGDLPHAPALLDTRLAGRRGCGC